MVFIRKDGDFQSSYVSWPRSVNAACLPTKTHGRTWLRAGTSYHTQSKSWSFSLWISDGGPGDGWHSIHQRHRIHIKSIYRICLNVIIQVHVIVNWFYTSKASYTGVTNNVSTSWSKTRFPEKDYNESSWYCFAKMVIWSHDIPWVIDDISYVLLKSWPLQNEPCPGILGDKWLFEKLSDLQLGDQNVTLNHVLLFSSSSSKNQSPSQAAILLKLTWGREKKLLIVSLFVKLHATSIPMVPSWLGLYRTIRTYSNIFMSLASSKDYWDAHGT